MNKNRLINNLLWDKDSKYIGLFDKYSNKFTKNQLTSLVKSSEHFIIRLKAFNLLKIDISYNRLISILVNVKDKSICNRCLIIIRDRFKDRVLIKELRGFASSSRTTFARNIANAMLEERGYLKW